MSLNRVILGDVARLVMLILGFVVYIRYAIVAGDINKALPVNRYCQELGKSDLICDNEYKFENFTIIYYDGLAKRYYDRFINSSKHKDYSVVYGINHEGLSDSVPAFYTYFSGKLPFNYDVNLRGEDNFFAQLSQSSIGITTFMNQQMIGLFDQNYEKNNTLEKRGLTYSMSPFFLDWCNMFVYNPNLQSIRVIDNLVIDKQSADELFDSEYRKYTDMLGKRKNELFSSLDAYFSSKPRSFIYIPDVDDFSHNVTIQNRGYISSIAALFTNLEALMDYFKQRRPNDLIITMSDHGGDESVPQQERYNHETPFNIDNNGPYVSLFSPSLDKKVFNNTNTLKATEVSSLISFLTKGLSLANGFDLAYGIFENVLMKLTYYRAFELKLIKYQKEIIGSDIEESSYYKNLTKKMKSMKLNNTYFNQEATAYKKHLRNLGEKVKADVGGKFKTTINLVSFLFAITTFAFYCFKLLARSLNVDLIHQNIEYILFSTFTIYMIISGTISETVFLGFIFLSFGLLWLKDKSDTYSMPERSFLFLSLAIYFLHLVALKFEWFFYNTKNPLSLILTSILMMLGLICLLKLPTNKDRLYSICMRILILGTVLANLAYDFLSLNQIAFENTKLIDFFRNKFIVCLILGLAFSLVGKSTHKSTYLVALACQFVFYVGNPYERFILYGLLVPQYIMINKIYAAVTEVQKQKITYAYTLLGFFIYLASGYYFDWRNRRRLYFKFDIIGFYKPMFLILCMTMSASLEWTRHYTKGEFMKPFQFIVGSLLTVVFCNLRYEYRTAFGKLLEFIGFTAFVYFYFAIIRGVEYLRTGRYSSKIDDGIEFQTIKDVPVSRMID